MIARINKRALQRLGDDGCTRLAFANNQNIHVSIQMSCRASGSRQPVRSDIPPVTIANAPASGQFQ
jgi:hypothetical protein